MIPKLYECEVTNGMKIAWRHFLKYRPLLEELVKRDLRLKYRRSFLGYLWSLLNPLLMMAIMTIVFSYMFKSNIENFPLYLICGNTLFSFFNESTNMAMYSVMNNGALIRKVYIPKFIFPISRVLSCFVTMSFSLVAILIVMVITHSTIYWTLILFWVPLMFLLVFCIGIGMVLSAISVFFRDVTHLYGVITIAWMYLTPIFYPVDSQFLPEQVIRFIQLNPLYHFITFFRQVVIYGSIPTWDTWCFCIVSCLAALVIGLAVFRKAQKNFILYL